jgi:hypothetical protein
MVIGNPKQELHFGLGVSALHAQRTSLSRMIFGGLLIFILITLEGTSSTGDMGGT